MASKSVMWRVSILLVLLLCSAPAAELLPFVPADLERLDPELATSPARSAFGARQMPYFILCMILFAFSFGAYRLRDRVLPLAIASLVACAFLIATMFWHDGTRIEGRRVAVYELTSVTGEARILQEQFLRPGMVKTSNLQLPESVRAIGSGSLRIQPRRDHSITVTGKAVSDLKIVVTAQDENLIQMKIEPNGLTLEEAWFVDESGLLWQGKNGQPDSNLLSFIPAGRDPKSLLAPVFTSASKQLRELLTASAAKPHHRNRLWAVVPDPTALMIPLHPDIEWLDSNIILTQELFPLPAR